MINYREIHAKLQTLNEKNYNKTKKKKKEQKEEESIEHGLI